MLYYVKFTVINKFHVVIENYNPGMFSSHCKRLVGCYSLGIIQIDMSVFIVMKQRITARQTGAMYLVITW